MTWSELKYETTTSPAQRKIPVAITLGGSRNGVDHVMITIRPSLLERFSWWAKDATVKVLLGVGEHARQIRIEPSATGKFRLTCTGKQIGARVPGFSLKLKLPSGTAPERRPNGGVEFDYSDKWLEVTLPKPNAALAPAKAPVPTPVNGAPFRTAATAGDVRPKVGGR